MTEQTLVPPIPAPTTGIYAAMRQIMVDKLYGGFALIFGLVCLSVVGISLWMHMRIGLNNDHLVLMDEVRKLLSGGIPYVDYTEVSPPLIHLLYIVPYLIAKLTDIPLYITLYSCTYAAIALSLFLCWKILRYSTISLNSCIIASSAIAVALIGVSFVHQVFADRDHLVMVMAAPWFILYSPRVKREYVPKDLRMITAALAAVAFAIKPYFYVFYMVTVASALIRTPVRVLLREREQHIIWGFALAYVALIFLCFQQYPFTILPAGLKTYAAIGWDRSAKWDAVEHELLRKYALLPLAATMTILCTFPQFLNLTIAYLYGLLLAALVSYVLNYGWYYTQYPFIGIALVLGVVSTATVLQAFALISSSIIRWFCRGVVLCGAIAQLYLFYWLPIAARATEDSMLWRTRGHTLVTFEMPPAAAERISKHLDLHPRFMFFTVDLWSVNLLKDGTPRENVGRFDILWPLPGILKLREKDDEQGSYDTLSEWLIDSVSSDIERHKPDLIINDVSPTKRVLPWKYNMLNFFNTSQRFIDAMEGYELVDRFDYCQQSIAMACSFDVYYRK